MQEKIPNSQPPTNSEAEVTRQQLSECGSQVKSAEPSNSNEAARHLLRLINRFQEDQIQLGRDFHDGPCQDLTGIAYLADIIALDLKKEHSESSVRVKEIGSLIRKSIDDLRRLMTNKPLNIIDRHGLAWALQDLADRMLQSGKQCTFEVPRTTVISNPKMEVLLLEIAEGALKFLIDRGEGEITRIELLRESGHAFLRVENDGVRGNQCLILSEDLRMMRTYISLLGGSLEIGSHGDDRTYVICTVPEETV